MDCRENISRTTKLLRDSKHYFKIENTYILLPKHIPFKILGKEVGKTNKVFAAFLRKSDSYLERKSHAFARPLIYQSLQNPLVNV